METFDTLKPDNQVKVTIWGPDDSELYQGTNTGYHNIETAISAAIDAAQLQMDPKDCVFEVANLSTGVTHKYRLNAHGHIKLII